ncbi:hypothetical protein CC80DRAFT_552665 [Byssothecium circinans]|uniref:F-box domain-containing protein n=1 Tax=Byssothecium circinans TaxID=147558 RepID=A0A6A5THB2_9PLEO|nr:hypothetical protein CC80DRAFT_552665 [Byssothecium circinans]
MSSKRSGTRQVLIASPSFLELLLEIGGHVPVKAFSSLSLVSHRFQDIFQTELYRDISLGYPLAYEYPLSLIYDHFPIGLLVRTLAERTDLAKMVTGLKMHIHRSRDGYCYKEKTCSPQTQDWYDHNYRCYNSLLSEDEKYGWVSHRVPGKNFQHEIEVARVLLTMLPNLKKLDASEDLEEGRELHSSTDQLNTLYGLSSLEEFNGLLTWWPLATLPNLKKITIQCSWPIDETKPQDNSKPSEITSLAFGIRAYPWLGWSNEDSEEAMITVRRVATADFELLPKLLNLRIWVTAYNHIQEGDWSVFIENLDAVSPHLEELEFLYGFFDDSFTEIKWLETLAPVKTLSNFVKLRKLSIWYPVEETFEWLQMLLLQKPKRQESIELICSPDKGEELDTITEMLETEWIIKAMKTEGTDVLVREDTVEARGTAIGLRDTW